MEKVLIAGGTGLVGSRLQALLPADKYEIHILSRSPRSAHDNVTYYKWDLEVQEIDEAALAVDYIVNLTGAGIADRRWSSQRKRVIIESRTQSVALLKKGLLSSGHRPKLYLGASAVGYYGDRAGELMTEESSPGNGFLSVSCLAWEGAHNLVSELVERSVVLRIGIVLSMAGGALPKMLMTRQIGLFNYFGSGDQYYSWIHIDDLCNMMLHMMKASRCAGVYNATAPAALSNKELMQEILADTSLSGVLLPAPAFALKVAMGEMSAVVLDSCKASSEKVTDAGFEFMYTSVGQAVSALIE